MLVKELIELLKNMPQDLEVRYKDSYFEEISFDNVSHYNSSKWDASKREYKLIPIVLLDADL